MTCLGIMAADEEVSLSEIGHGLVHIGDHGRVSVPLSHAEWLNGSDVWQSSDVSIAFGVEEAEAGLLDSVTMTVPERDALGLVVVLLSLAGAAGSVRVRCRESRFLVISVAEATLLSGLSYSPLALDFESGNAPSAPIAIRRWSRAGLVSDPLDEAVVLPADWDHRPTLRIGLSAFEARQVAVRLAAQCATGKSGSFELLRLSGMGQPLVVRVHGAP